jgi:serine/threonine protein kinase
LSDFSVNQDILYQLLGPRMTADGSGHSSQTLADRYRMTKKVGDGTFGEVSLAKKLDTGDIVAIKRFAFK